ncbi:MAG: TVP38/TMEM64 family protein, partial [Pseudanabaena sp.]
MNKKLLIGIFALTVVSGWITFTHIDGLNQIQDIAQESGIWGYAFFVITYAIATLLILPVTAFNIAGGALYGGIEGLLLTS